MEKFGSTIPFTNVVKRYNQSKIKFGSTFSKGGKGGKGDQKWKSLAPPFLKVEKVEKVEKVD